eukprot:Selendium_serpulae@DN5808_c0_g1_i2.p1
MDATRIRRIRTLQIAECPDSVGRRGEHRGAVGVEDRSVGRDLETAGVVAPTQNVEVTLSLHDDSNTTSGFSKDGVGVSDKVHASFVIPMPSLLRSSWASVKSSE